VANSSNVIKTIVFGSDFSAVSEGAERYAFDIAALHGATLLALHAIEPIEVGEQDEADRRFVERLRKLSEGRMEALRERALARGIRIECATTVGKRWKEIARLAIERKADLIVVGARRHPEGHPPTLSTTSHNLFLSSEIPVLVVRQREPA